MLFDVFDKYSEDLLLAQYKIADIFDHELTKGEIREDFLIYILKSRFEPPPSFHKGTISDGTNQAGQIDLMLCRPNCQIVRLGKSAILRPEDCLFLLEIKGNATGNDIKEFDNRVQRIKSMNAPNFPLFGIFCYKVDLKGVTILNRFGYYYDANTNSFYDDTKHPREITYNNIDMFISLDSECPVFLRKMNNGRFTRIFDYPIIKNVFQVVSSLIQTTYQEKTTSEPEIITDI